MPKPTFWKGLALLSSASLVIFFLLYRAGTFDNCLESGEPDWQTSPNGGPFRANGTDTSIKPKKDTVLTILPSSKSAMVVEIRAPLIKDTLPAKTVDSITPPTRFMGGSKSVIIIDNKIRKKAKKDSLKRKLKKEQ